MEELSRSKKDFETIIQAKNRELERTKVLERRWRFRIWLVHAAQHFQQCMGCYVNGEGDYGCTLPQGK
jgi:hypothetical protein